MTEIPPNVRPPTPDEIREFAATHHMSLSADEVEDFQTAIEGALAMYERLDELPDPQPGTEYTTRDPGRRLDGDADPLNCYVRTCRVPGADAGPLAGYEVGLKDNIAVAGVEMTAGSKLFEGYVPAVDATVVTRLLDAGATITAKLNMEDMALSGSGELSATGPVVNPRDSDHLAGGSSSGSIAAVVSGEVDVAIGGDQGGSVRIPAAWSGGVGHKPTYGLVPYTGILGLGHSFDHAGPMATSVADCARVLDVIAGKDPRDPRQGAVPTASYVDALEGNPDELTVGVLAEGFGHPQSQAAVDETVGSALDAFEAAGATVRSVSVPMHRDGMAIWNAVLTEELTALVRDEGVGRYGKGYYDTQLADAFGRARRAQADDYVATIKLTLVLGQYLSEEYRGHYYAKAQNLRRELADRYDAVLADVDVLAMPTTPQTAHERREEVSRLAALERSNDMVPNTAPFDVTGHPAISVPAGEAAGLPAGLMFVGDTFADDTVLRAAHAYEQSVGWTLS